MKKRLGISVIIAGLMYTLAKTRELLPQESVEQQIVSYTIIFLCVCLIVSIVSSPPQVRALVRNAVASIIDMATPKYDCPQWVKRADPIIRIIGHGGIGAIAIICGSFALILLIAGGATVELPVYRVIGSITLAFGLMILGGLYMIDALNTLHELRQPDSR